jgi:hypothetical protein
MFSLGAALLLGGSLQLLVAAVGYVRGIRDAYYDAIATGTLFDGRWIFGCFGVAAGVAILRHWSWVAAMGLVVAGYIAILPVKALLRAAFGRRSSK